jgi:CheY-like chemotaxis protein
VLRSLGEGFRVIQADSGQRAWEILLLEPSIGAVLSDLSMPGVDGFELLRRVRGSMLARVQGIPFVVLSGAVDPVHRDRAISLGADRFIVKGDGFDALKAWLLRRLDNHVVPHDDAGNGYEPGAAPVEAKSLPLASSSPLIPMPQRVATPRLVPEDPLHTWFQAALARISPTPAAPAVLYRVSAPGLPDLTARLRAGIRSADALYLDGLDAGWLCACGPHSQTVRLGLRFALLAAGRQAGAQHDSPRIDLCMQPVDPSHTLGALASLARTAPLNANPAGPSIRVLPGLWGAGWQCDLPWEAVRLLST